MSDYSIDTPDKALIDDARHVVGGGSLRQLARKLGKTEACLRHVLSGRTDALDAPTRTKIEHLIVREQAREMLAEGADERWAEGNRLDRVVEHLLTCSICLTSAIQHSERHFRDSVARIRRI